MLKKCPTTQGMRINTGSVASSVLSFCITSHSGVCELMTALIKHNSLTPPALIHPYIRALLPLNFTVGTRFFSLL